MSSNVSEWVICTWLSVYRCSITQNNREAKPQIQGHIGSVWILPLVALPIIGAPRIWRRIQPPRDCQKIVWAAGPRASKKSNPMQTDAFDAVNAKNFGQGERYKQTHSMYALAPFVFLNTTPLTCTSVVDQQNNTFRNHGKKWQSITYIGIVHIYDATKFDPPLRQKVINFALESSKKISPL